MPRPCGVACLTDTFINTASAVNGCQEALPHAPADGSRLPLACPPRRRKPLLTLATDVSHVVTIDVRGQGRAATVKGSISQPTTLNRRTKSEATPSPVGEEMLDARRAFTAAAVAKIGIHYQWARVCT